METIYELQRKASGLRQKTLTDSITPEEVGGIQYGTLAYIAGMEQNLVGLGILKTYRNKAEMEADTKPVGNHGKPFRFGQLAAIYNSADEEAKDNGMIYAWQNPGWLPVGKLGMDFYHNLVDMDSLDMGLDADSPDAGLAAVYDSIDKGFYRVVSKENRHVVAGTLMVFKDGEGKTLSQVLCTNLNIDKNGDFSGYDEGVHIYFRIYRVSDKSWKDWTDVLSGVGKPVGYHGEIFNDYEGNNASAYAHAEGQNCSANGDASHAEGKDTDVEGHYGHAEGLGTIADNEGEHAEGMYNRSNPGTRHSIGIGTSKTARRNAMEVMSDGRMFVHGIGGYNGVLNEKAHKTIQEVVAENRNAEIKKLDEGFDFFNTRFEEFNGLEDGVHVYSGMRSDVDRHVNRFVRVTQYNESGEGKFQLLEYFEEPDGGHPVVYSGLSATRYENEGQWETARYRGSATVGGVKLPEDGTVPGMEMIRVLGTARTFAGRMQSVYWNVDYGLLPVALKRCQFKGTGGAVETELVFMVTDTDCMVRASIVTRLGMFTQPWHVERFAPGGGGGVTVIE